ncbi:MAG TPA: M1 family aminopeptidase [Blastocatellia bacterium]|jgi:aminopeptidase N|nr:M1 family aminopeptidase [Blastocatellia bacterium]
MVAFFVMAAISAAYAQEAGLSDRAPESTDKPSSRDSYRIEIDLDYHKASFTGRETLRFTNTTREELDYINFYLYPNFGLSDDDKPSLAVQKVTAGGRELYFGARSHNALLRVDLPQKLQPGRSIELTLDFSARVPRVQREETSLLAHFLQEIGDALSDERQPKDARDIFFAGEEAMLLGHFFPTIAPHEQQTVEQNLAVSVSSLINGEIADYEVTVRTDERLTVVASAECVESRTQQSDGADKRRSQTFRGEKLRGFAVAVVERMKSAERKTGATRAVSYFRESDERIGKRALDFAVNAIDVYEKSFGPSPYSLLQVVEMPLAAGYSNVQFPGMVVVAQAYYIDFDAPEAARLPGVLREQSDIVKSSFEFTIAYGVAKQWWGEAVGGDSERAPYLDEALANFSAAYYHEAVYGKKLGDLIIDQQLRGAYQAYRMLGGVDVEAEKPVKEFRNSLQYTAIVQAKGGLLFVAMRKELGDERFFDALRQYYSKNSFRVATPETMRNSFIAASENPRAAQAIFQRWLKEKRGDEDIGAPDMTLIPPRVSKIRALGRVFVKIGKTAAKPF